MEDFTQVLLVIATVYLKILRRGTVIKIWNKVFFKIIVYFDGLVIRKKVLLESCNHIETHIDVVVEALEVHISVSFELCLDKYSIELW